MALTDMKFTKAEAKKRNSPMPMSPSSDDGPSYPYGLSIELGKEALKKLGMDSLPKVGETIELKAKAEVIGVSSSAGKGNESREVRLQITHLDIAEGLED